MLMFVKKGNWVKTAIISKLVVKIQSKMIIKAF